MNSRNFMFAIGGAIIGSALTFVFSKSYFEKIANDEIESVKEVYSSTKHKSNIVDVRKVQDKQMNPVSQHETTSIKPSSKSTRAILYDTYFEKSEEIEEINDSENQDTPVVNNADGHEIYQITEEEFDNNEELEDSGKDPDLWHKVVTMYYADGYICNELDRPFDDPKRVLGDDIIEKLKFKPQCMYIRNERLCCDYELLRSDRFYLTDVLPTLPPSID